jgi:predicted O-methyltransferase YrrM
MKRKARSGIKEVIRWRTAGQPDFPPGHYYSPIPDFPRLRDHPPTPDSLAGVDLREQEQLSLLQELAEFSAPLPRRPTEGSRYYTENDYYAAADGAVLSAMLSWLRPNRVVEVGSGFSSALMLDTADRHGLDTRFTFIDPNPQRLLAQIQGDARPTVITRPVQEVTLDTFLDLDAGDVLFVDSSHVVKTGSDVNWIYFEIFPRLRPGVAVHVHDVFWPFTYPAAYLDRGWAWNEAYLLRALLTFSGLLEIMLFPGWLEVEHPDKLAAALPLAMEHPPSWPTLRGASIWLRRI